jgi:hypothetical protein
MAAAIFRDHPPVKVLENWCLNEANGQMITFLLFISVYIATVHRQQHVSNF